MGRNSSRDHGPEEFHQSTTSVAQKDRIIRLDTGEREQVRVSNPLLKLAGRWKGKKQSPFALYRISVIRHYEYFSLEPLHYLP